MWGPLHLRVGDTLRPGLGVSGQAWLQLGASWSHPGSKLGRPVAILVRSWGVLGPSCLPNPFPNRSKIKQASDQVCDLCGRSFFIDFYQVVHQQSMENLSHVEGKTNNVCRLFQSNFLSTSCYTIAINKESAMSQSIEHNLTNNR